MGDVARLHTERVYEVILGIEAVGDITRLHPENCCVLKY